MNTPLRPITLQQVLTRAKDFDVIACMNLIGIIPAFEAPTMFTWVPAGLAG